MYDVPIFDIVLPFAALTAAILLVWFLYVFRQEGSAKGIIETVSANLAGNDLSEPVRLESLANFEKDLPPGSVVTVLAHTIDEPQDALRAAVQDNFQQGIKYIFLVSKSEFSRSIAEHHEFFEAIYVIARRIAPVRGSNAQIKDLSFDELFAIHALAGEWTSWPYVLYRIPSGNGKFNIVVFRGNQRKEGIAEQYVQLDAIEAEAFFNAIRLSIIGSEQRSFLDDTVVSEVESNNFVDDKVIKLSERRMST
jgi:hypothetical protein